MNISAMTPVLPMLVSLAALFLAGNACNKVPTMTWAEACLKASSTPSLYNLCQETLQYAPDAAEATVYARVAATIAKKSYEATTAEAVSLLLHGSLPGDELAALELCVRKSSEARSGMLAVVNDMSGCEFKNTAQEYVDSMSAVESCRDALSEFPGSPLIAMNAADRDMTTVAQDLGALIFGRS